MRLKHPPPGHAPRLNEVADYATGLAVASRP